ncbi:uncharacterized protein F5891DRAFT_1247477 [Suillus fuscotomentosus]|uniref:Uncharacterized protein n=1 Tax=Suillus fuscotomentosus TaxID=1912939 RepID=A0AAD4DYC6_9AGAM|nr:uncharacterized protein F5891DRAFT_1247477 [Suillus fuscotomentosus]KAG1896376.1 hypothetical protein F5891DRAFT_1247477 [Suillus fuscotomentosus]
MPFPFKLIQGFRKIVAIHLKRPENQGCTQCNSTTAGHEGNTSIPADLSNFVPASMLSSNSSPMHPIIAGSKPGVENFPPSSPFTAYPWGASPAREASDIAQVALPLIQAFTDVISLVGAPMNTAIGGLLGILQVINVSHYRMLRCFWISRAITEIQSEQGGLGPLDIATLLTILPFVQRLTCPGSS